MRLDPRARRSIVFANRHRQMLVKLVPGYYAIVVHPINESKCFGLCGA